MKDWKMHEEKN